jgi:HEAT repeat protein
VVKEFDGEPAVASRRRAAALAGHTGDEQAARRLLDDADPEVRATAFAALVRMDRIEEEDVAAAVGDADAVVRRRGCEVAAAVGVDVTGLLHDADPSVVEMAAWALGEQGRPGAVEALAAVAAAHDDALCREAAVAALGAIGDERGLPTILAACTDKPAVRRRAVLALAPFDGPDVEAALRRALDDRDWQVRQAAEDLLAESP